MSLAGVLIAGRTSVLAFLFVSSAMLSITLPHAVGEAVIRGAVRGSVASNPDHGKSAVLRTILVLGMALDSLVAVLLFVLTWGLPGGSLRQACLVPGVFLAIQLPMLVSFGTSNANAFAEASKTRAGTPSD